MIAHSDAVLLMKVARDLLVQASDKLAEELANPHPPSAEVYMEAIDTQEVMGGILEQLSSQVTFLETMAVKRGEVQ